MSIAGKKTKKIKFIIFILKIFDLLKKSEIKS